jgi:drug/metabolite transporter (DMT)-like permease
MSKTSSHVRLQATVVTIACGILWGLLWIPLRWLDSRGLGVAWVSLIFSVAMFVTPLPWLFRKSNRNYQSIAAVGGSLLLGTGFTLYLISFLFTEISNTIILYYLTPAWSVLIGILFLGHRPEAWRFIAIVLGFIGMLAVLGHENGFPTLDRIGDWTALASGILWSIGSLMIANRQSGIVMPTAMFGLGGVISSLVVLLVVSTWGPAHAAASSLQGNFLPAILIAMVIFVPPNMMLLWAQQRLDAPRVGILLMGELLVGVTTAALFSGESFTVLHAIGATMIVLAGLIETGMIKIRAT